MSSDRVDRLTARASQPDGDAAGASDASLDFVRFCYRRRRVAWPTLYDEMCAVASRGAFRGLGYAELAEHGISFCLPDLPLLAALAEQVMLEERAGPEPLRGTSDASHTDSPRAEVAGAIRLAAAPVAS